MMTKVAIIVPVYNQERYLKQCLDSLVNQTYKKDVKIICINDGSTDSSLAILKEYEANYDNVVVKTKANGGLSSARNFGLDCAFDLACDYIMFVDSDDRLTLDTIDIAVTSLEDANSDLVVFGMRAFSEGNITQDLDIMNDYLEMPFEGFTKYNFDIAKSTNIHVCNKLFKANLIDNLRFKEGLLYEDIYFMWSYFFRASSISYTKNICYYYRVHQGSIMETTFKDKSFDRAIHHLKNWYELFRDNNNTKSFFEHYDELLYLLDRYDRNTKRTCDEKDYYKIEVVYNLCKNELETTHRRLLNAIKFD